MKKICVLFLFLLINSFYALAEEWSAYETSAIDVATCAKLYPHHMWVDAPIDPFLHPEKQFQLFVYSNKEFDPTKPSVVYLLGGPGKVIPVNDVSVTGFQKAMDAIGVNALFFHLRGAGCSQLPLDKSYDNTLNSFHMISDLQLIQQILGIQKWDGIVGHSYGAILATQFTSKYPDAVRKVLLIGTPGDLSEDRYFYEIVPDVFQKLIVRLKKEDPNKWNTLEIQIERAVKILQQLVESKTDFYAILASPESIELNSIPEFLKPYQDHLIPVLYSAYLLNYVGWNPSNDQMRATQEWVVELLVWSLNSQPIFSNQNFLEMAEQNLKKEFAIHLDGSKVHQPKDQSAESSNWPAIPMFSNRVMTVLLNGELYSKDQSQGYDPKKFSHSVQTLFLAGDADGATPVSQSLFASQFLKNSTVLIRKGGGHRNLLAESAEVELMKFYFGSEEPLSVLFQRNALYFNADDYRIEGNLGSTN